MAHKLLAADRVIHEQQLGWQWRGPDEEALLAGPHSPQATRTLGNSRKKTSSVKAGSEIGENEEMPDGQSQPIPFSQGTLANQFSICNMPLSLMLRAQHPFR